MELDNQVNSKYLDMLHKDILVVMDEIDRICKYRGLRYYLAGGSCLGALRHKGFIPWDDDLDILMPYDDFKKFIESLRVDLKDDFYLEWVTTNNNYHQDFAKICLRNTEFVEDGWECERTFGIFVDIFPLYPSTECNKCVLLKKKIYNFLHAAMFCKSRKNLDWGWRNWPINIISRTFSSLSIYKLMLFVINPLKDDEAQYYACYPSTYPINRQVFPKEWYRKCIPTQFEDRYYMCAIDSDKKMLLEYGENYMELPPMNKRKTHYPLFVKFSDGSTCKFSKHNSKVTYEDIVK